MWDWVWYSIFDIRFECWIQFDIRYSTFDLNVGLSLIFDIRHSKFECWMLNIEHLTKFWLLILLVTDWGRSCKPQCTAYNVNKLNLVFHDTWYIYKETLCIQHYWASPRQNLSSGLPTRWDSHQAPQLHLLARKLKFRLQQVWILYFPISEKRRRWSVCADAQVGLHLCCSQTPEDRFSCVYVHIMAG